MLAFVSCSDSDSDSDKVDKAILGTWQEDDTTDGIWRWTFKASGKGSCAVSGRGESYSFGFRFTYLNNKLIISGKEDGKPYTDNYSVIISSNGNKMTWIEKTKYGDTTFNLTKK